MFAQMIKLKVPLWVSLLIILLVASDGLTNDTTGVTENEVRVGVFQPITGSASVIGRPVMQGFITVLNLTNEAGGVHGRKIIAFVEDDANNPERAKSAAKKLIYNNEVFAMQGSTTTFSTLAAKREIEDANVPWLVGAATTEKIYYPTVRTTYGFTTTSKSLARVTTRFMLSKPDVKKIVFVYQHTEWSKAVLESAIKEFEESKRKDVEFITEVVETGTTDATPAILKIKKYGADAIGGILYPQEAAILVRDAYKYGLKVPIVLAGAANDLRDVKMRTGIPESMKWAFVCVATTLCENTASDPRYSELTTGLKKYFPEAKIQGQHAYGFAYGRIFVEALRRSGRNLTRERFLDVLENLRDFDTGVLFGKVSYSKTDHLAEVNYVFLALKKDGNEYFTDKPEWNPDIMRKRNWE